MTLALRLSLPFALPLYHLVVNAERQTIKYAKIFQVNMSTTAEALLNDIYKTFSDPKRPKGKVASCTPSPLALTRTPNPNPDPSNSNNLSI